jgi:ATP-dependent Clp protease ATP-binding subunit ClpA
MNGLLFEGIKHGYLREYSRWSFPKSDNQCSYDENYINKLLNILMRYTKGNIILSGKGSLQNTAILDAVGSRLKKKTGYQELDNMKIYVFYPAKFAANYENSAFASVYLKRLMDEVVSKGNAILLINNVREILYESYLYNKNNIDLNTKIFHDLAQNSKLKFIGTIEPDDDVFGQDKEYIQRKWKEYVEVVNLPGTKEEESINDIESETKRIEKYYDIKIDPKAVELGLRLAEKYIKEGAMPKKAFLLLDEVIIKYRIKNGLNACNKTGFVLKEEMVRALVAEKTGISINKIDKSDCIEEMLASRIIGQNHVAKAVSQAIRTIKAGLGDKNRPEGIFYFLGPSGVGKTEFAQTLSEVIYGDRSKLLRVDMSELNHPGDVTRLIGASPGYVGYDDGGVLTNWAMENPESVILLDEFEKAHPKCWDVFLQMFDAGRLRNGRGRIVDFNKTIIILTSNIGSENFIKRSDQRYAGFVNGNNNNQSLDLVKINENIHAQLIDTFRSEFLNRIDEIFIFNPLSLENLVQISRIMLKNVPVNLQTNDEILRFIARTGYDPKYGARNLKRVIKKLILDPVANMIIDGSVRKGDTIKIFINKEILSFSKVNN